MEFLPGSKNFAIQKQKKGYSFPSLWQITQLIQTDILSFNLSWHNIKYFTILDKKIKCENAYSIQMFKMKGPNKRTVGFLLSNISIIQ